MPTFGKPLKAALALTAGAGLFLAGLFLKPERSVVLPDFVFTGAANGDQY